MANMRKFYIWLSVFLAVLLVYVVFNRLANTPEIENPTVDLGGGIESPDLKGAVNQIGDVKISDGDNAEYITVDPETGRVTRVSGFEKLLNPSKGSTRWRMLGPYMNVYEDDLTCSVTAENGNVQVETVGGKPTPSDAQLSGDVQIKIVSTDEANPLKCTIYLDDVDYSSERSEFRTDGRVRVVSQSSEMVGTGMDMIYNPAVGRLDYLKINDLDYIHIKDISGLSSMSDKAKPVKDTPKANPGNGVDAGEGGHVEEESDLYNCTLLENVMVRYGQQLVVVGADSVSISNILLGSGPESKKEETISEAEDSITEVSTDVASAEAVVEKVEEVTEVFVTCDGGIIVRPMGDMPSSDDVASGDDKCIVEVIGKPIYVKEVNESKEQGATIAQCGVIKYNVDTDTLDMFTNAYQQIVALTISDSDASLETAGSVKWQRRDDRATINGPGKLFMRSNASAVEGGNKRSSEMCFDGVMNLFFAKVESEDSMGLFAIKSANLTGGVSASIEDGGASKMKSDHATFVFDESNEISEADLAGNVSFSSENGSVVSEQAKIYFAKDADGNVYADRMQSVGDAVLEPIAKEGAERPARFNAAKIDYDIVTGSALAQGPVKFVFYAAKNKDGGVVEDRAAEPVPVVITAKDNAEYFSKENRIVFNGDVVGRRESVGDLFTQTSTFYGDKLTVDLAEGDAATGKDVRLASVSVTGSDVKLESVRTADGVTVNHIVLMCEQIDYDESDQVVTAMGPGEIQINNENAPVPVKKDGGQKLSLEGPCFARIFGFDELKWNTADNKIFARSKDEAVNIGYMPIVDGVRGNIIRAAMKNLEASFVTLPSGRSELAGLKATNGVFYEEEDSHIFRGDSLLYNGITSVMTFRGTEREPCFADGVRVPMIEYNLATGDVNTELSTIPGAVSLPTKVK